MKKPIVGSLAGLLILGLTIAGTDSAGQDKGVQSLRGATSLEQTEKAPELKKLQTGRRFIRAYRQQPPLIPHAIDKYQIDLKVNQCMRCHDWPRNVEENAPKISETHYVNRNGVALDRVTASRWFCNQCHVPQAQARALVPNKFQNSLGK